MATIFGKLFGAVKAMAGQYKAPVIPLAPSMMRTTDKARVLGKSSTAKTTMPRAFGSPRRNKLGRKMIRRYGYYNVMLTQPAVRDKIIAGLTARKTAIEAAK